mmetsp:Transcript_29820/g.76376  ORF Transcript_29820/g.76376 Transcript_29820/m.76376 type:complete len:227 (+) Transcript_29820:42-722(+)
MFTLNSSRVRTPSPFRSNTSKRSRGACCCIQTGGAGKLADAKDADTAEKEPAVEPAAKPAECRETSPSAQDMLTSRAAISSLASSWVSSRCIGEPSCAHDACEHGEPSSRAEVGDPGASRSAPRNFLEEPPFAAEFIATVRPKSTSAANAEITSVTTPTPPKSTPPSFAAVLCGGGAAAAVGALPRVEPSVIMTTGCSSTEAHKVLLLAAATRVSRISSEACASGQ